MKNSNRRGHIYIDRLSICIRIRIHSGFWLKTRMCIPVPNMTKMWRVLHPNSRGCEADFRPHPSWPILGRQHFFERFFLLPGGLRNRMWVGCGKNKTKRIDNLKLLDYFESQNEGSKNIELFQKDKNDYYDYIYKYYYIYYDDHLYYYYYYYDYNYY
mgnify:CR=1 FL=1